MFAFTLLCLWLCRGLVYNLGLFSFDVFLIVLEDVSPDLSLPLVEVILGLAAFSVPFAILKDPLTPELLKTLIDELSYEVELLIGAVPEAKHSKSDTLEKLGVLCLVLSSVTEPAIELLGVVTGVTLVVCRSAHYNQAMLLELFLCEFVKVEDLSRPLRVIFAEHSGQLLFQLSAELFGCPCLTPKVEGHLLGKRCGDFQLFDWDRPLNLFLRLFRLFLLLFLGVLLSILLFLPRFGPLDLFWRYLAFTLYTAHLIIVIIPMQD